VLRPAPLPAVVEASGMASARSPPPDGPGRPGQVVSRIIKLGDKVGAWAPHENRSGFSYPPLLMLKAAAWARIGHVTTAVANHGGH